MLFFIKSLYHNADFIISQIYDIYVEIEKL
nr:MAG TPA: hypothetical protein [Caudoviricetes sp.]